VYLLVIHVNNGYIIQRGIVAVSGCTSHGPPPSTSTRLQTKSSRKLDYYLHTSSVYIRSVSWTCPVVRGIARVVSVGAEPAQHVYCVTSGGDL